MKTTLKELLRPLQTAQERFSFRVQNGVEIYEHESLRARSVHKRTELDSKRSREPRLIVEESNEQPPSMLLTKRRSEVGDLVHLLKSVIAVEQV